MSNNFYTKIDYSNNRQIKQYPLTNTTLSGSTTLGVPFSGLPSGPDDNSSGITESYSTINGSYSSNTVDTVFYFNDDRLTLANEYLSAITTSNSGITQETGYIFTSNSSTTIDGNQVDLTFTGVSYSLDILTIDDIGGGDYTGTTEAFNVDILSADSLDYTGRTIWCDIPGILKVDNLIETNTIKLEGDLSACTGTIYATSFSGCSPMNLYGVIEIDNGVATVLGDLTVLGDFKLSGGGKTELFTETIVAEDNNIELNYGGNHQTAINGGIVVLSGQPNNENSQIFIDEYGYWTIEPGLRMKEFTPTSTNDTYGKEGELVWDDNFIYLKRNTGWGRIPFQDF